MKHLLLATAVVFFSLPTTAQVLPGHSVEFSKGGPPGAASGAFSDVIDTLDWSLPGPLIPVTGGSLSSTQLEGGVIDPITGDLWVLETGPTANTLVSRYSMSGSAIVNEVPVLVSVPGVTEFTDIDLDGAGNVFVCSQQGVWKVDRHTFAVTMWAGPNAVGTTVALTIDRGTNTMWVGSRESFGAELREFDLNAGPSIGTHVLDISGSGMPSFVAGICNDGNGSVYVATWQGLFRFDVAGGTAALVPCNVLMDPFFGIFNEFSSIDYNSIDGTLHTAGGLAGNGAYYSIDPVSGASVLLNDSHSCALDFVGGQFCFDPDVMTGLSVNDFGNTTVAFPNFGSVSSGFTLEVSTHGPPGDLALMAVTAVNGIDLGAGYVLIGSAGFCDAGGNYSHSEVFSGGSLPSFLTSVTFRSATVDGPTGVATLASSATINLLP